MDEIECGTVVCSPSCTENQLDLAFTNTGSTEKKVEFTLPEGTKFYDQDGVLVFEITSGPKKSSIRIPAGE